MAYHIYSWEEFEQRPEDPGVGESLVLHVGGRRIRARVEENEEDEDAIEREPESLSSSV
jgi:hypothetical protein